MDSEENILKKKNLFLWLIPALIVAGVLTFYFLTSAPDPAKGPQLTPEEPGEQAIEKPPETPVETFTEKPVEKPLEPEVREEGPKELYRLKTSQILSMEFISESEKISIAKVGSRWSVNNDRYSRIEQQKVISSIEKLSSLTSLETVSFKTSDPGQWGISPSSRTIRVQTSEGLITIILGSLNPPGTAYYLQILGKDEIYLVKNSIGESLKLTLDDLRDRNLVLFDKSGIETLSIKNEKQISIIPYRQYDEFTAGKFSYMLEAPYNAYIPVSNQEFSAFISTLKPSIHIVDFIDEGLPADYGINESSARISVKEKDGRSFELLLGESAGNSKIYGKVTGEKQIFTMESKDLTFLKLKPFDLVDRLPHLISLESIDTFMISNEELALIATVERLGERDRFMVNGLETEEKTFRDLYKKIQELTLSGEAEQLVNREKPEIIISYKLYDGGSLWSHVNFFPYDQKHYAVVRNEEESLFIIEKVQLDQMLKDVTSTVDKIMGF